MDFGLSGYGGEYGGEMELEGSDAFSMMSYFKGSTVAVQSFSKSGNQHPLRPTNIADCQALHKRCTLVFSLLSGAPTTVNIKVVPMFPDKAQPLLHIAPTSSGDLVSSDTFTLVNTGDYHEVEMVPKYKKHHRADRPHYNVVISIDGEAAFQWHTVVHHPGYAKPSDDANGPVELRLESGPEIDGINFGLFPHETRELETHQPSLTDAQIVALASPFGAAGQQEHARAQHMEMGKPAFGGGEREVKYSESPAFYGGGGEREVKYSQSAAFYGGGGGSAVDFAPMPPKEMFAGGLVEWGGGELYEMGFVDDSMGFSGEGVAFPGDGSVNSWAALLDSNTRTDFTW